MRCWHVAVKQLKNFFRMSSFLEKWEIFSVKGTVISIKASKERANTKNRYTIERLSQIVYWFSSVNVWLRCDTDSENGWTWLTNAYSNLTLSLWPLAFLKLSGHRAHKQLFKGRRCGSYGEFLKSYYFIISQLTELRSASATIFIGNSI